MANSVIVGLGKACFSVERKTKQPPLINRGEQQLMRSRMDTLRCRWSLCVVWPAHACILIGSLIFPCAKSQLY